MDAADEPARIRFDELARIHRELDEIFDRMNARFDRIDKTLEECCAAINLMIESTKTLKGALSRDARSPMSPERAHETGQLYLALSEQLEASGASAQAALERQRAESWLGRSRLASAGSMKLCVDCSWIQRAESINKSRCGHGLAKRTETSPIDGTQRSFQISCWHFRLMPDGCDEGGKLWQPKNVGFE